MKVYELIVINMFTGEIIEEISYDYKGSLTQCKGGDQKAATAAAERAYKLQLEQVNLQQDQINELAAEEKAKKLNAQQLLESGLKRKTGRASTILTNIQDFGTANVSRKSLYG